MDDQYQWQFVRRFFIIDTVGSVEPSSGGDPSTETKIPKNIRYLKSIHIRYVHVHCSKLQQLQ